ncbi:hypothetical protein MAR_021193 [Mya arenaria]|uniref:Uncharacterized protein n=1 Tax=Mya arenaria TaxID=6604 RepID=A0ABY7EBN0_MYAAR|nr:hypothetical protein MAR_021193 [Mya arenaria]
MEQGPCSVFKHSYIGSGYFTQIGGWGLFVHSVKDWSTINGQTTCSPNGPDHAAVLPANTLYVLNDGSTMDSVVCSSDCFPECSLMWLPSSSSYQENLSLGVLHKEAAGLLDTVSSSDDRRLRKFFTKGTDGDDEETLPDEVENPMYVGADDMGVPSTAQTLQEDRAEKNERTR